MSVKGEKIMRKGKILTGVIAIISIVLLAVVGIVNASNAKSYLVEIIDEVVT